MSEQKYPVVMIEKVTIKNGIIQRGDYNWVPVHKSYSDVNKAIETKVMTLIDDEPDLMILITSKRMTESEIQELRAESLEGESW